MKTIVKIFLGIISVGLLGVVGIVALVMNASMNLPQINSLADYNPPLPTKIYSKDGELLLEIGKEKREVVELKNIPQRVIDSFLAAEDDNFYQHKGVDYYGLFRAALKNIKAGRVVQGGSTITQQVAKSLLLTKERSFSRKIKDFLLAQKIEEKFSKEEILFLYLNQVYLGGGNYGVKMAFKGYFDKELKDASIAESALVAGLLVAPGKYSPTVNPQFSKTRQKYVLKRMYETKKITEEEYQNALKEKIKIYIRPIDEIKAGYFSDWIRQRLMDKLGVDQVLENGYHVTTTLDWSLQKKAEEYVLEGIRDLDKRQGFIGPTSSLKNEEINNWISDQVKKIADRYSSYFYLDTEGNAKREILFDQEEWNEIVQKNENLQNKYNKEIKEKILIGNPKHIKNLKLKNGEYYDAVVTNVSDFFGLIFANVAGFSVIVPQEGFNWAYPRKLSEERSFATMLNKPSSIFKIGDIIKIKIIKQDEKISNYTKRETRNLFLKDPYKNFSQNNKYHIASLEQNPTVQGALFSVSTSGDILAMVGGNNFEESKFNRVIQSNRQPGSSFKPFIYAAGLEKGFNPSSILLDSPQALGGIDDTLSWKPRNYDGEFLGPITFRYALEKSRNIPTIRLLQDIGISYLIDFSKRLQIPAKLPEDLSISLGSFGIPLYDLVQSYAIFPNLGKRVVVKSITSIKDRNGKVYSLSEHTTQTTKTSNESEIKSENSNESDIQENLNSFTANLNNEQVFDPRLSYIMTNILRGVITSGTATQASHLSSNIAGKTGTTNNYVDSLFVGYTPTIITGVWAGFDDNKTLGFGETGARSALPIWINFTADVLKKYGDHEFRVPAGIIHMLVDKETGRKVKSHGKGIIMESFAEGSSVGNSTNSQDIDKNIEDSIINDEDYYNNQ